LVMGGNNFFHLRFEILHFDHLRLELSLFLDSLLHCNQIKTLVLS
jgi:hypothetical protein